MDTQSEIWVWQVIASSPLGEPAVFVASLQNVACTQNEGDGMRYIMSRSAGCLAPSLVYTFSKFNWQKKSPSLLELCISFSYLIFPRFKFSGTLQFGTCDVGIGIRTLECSAHGAWWTQGSLCKVKETKSKKHFLSSTSVFFPPPARKPSSFLCSLIISYY